MWHPGKWNENKHIFYNGVCFNASFHLRIWRLFHLHWLVLNNVYTVEIRQIHMQIWEDSGWNPTDPSSVPKRSRSIPQPSETTRYRSKTAVLQTFKIQILDTKHSSGSPSLNFIGKSFELFSIFHIELRSLNSRKCLVNFVADTFSGFIIIHEWKNDGLKY